MIRSLFTGVTGLKQHQTRMDVISNNVANVNTTGFKRGRAMFQDLFSQTLRHAQQAFGTYGGLNPMQVGHGVSLAAIDTMMEQGTLETTGKHTDLAIEGAGFFSTRGADGNVYYTRDGNLNINPNYDLVMTNTGFKMQGWLSTQDPATGNLELNDTGTVPYDINIVKYLKKHAHQTNQIEYASNLDSGSAERDVMLGLDTLTFKDSEGNFQDLTFKFKKLDAQNWVWSAMDDTEGNVATGIIKTDENGMIISSEVDPAGPTSSVATPYFVYDPDGSPTPATATMPLNNPTNTGNGISSGVIASGGQVADEVVSVIFDGGDPTRATSFRVVGSERGYIGAGTLGGTQARIQGGPTLFGLGWTPSANTSFTVRDIQPPNRATTEATINFNQGTTYSVGVITDTINNALKENDVRATAFYDSVTESFTIVSNEAGSNRTIELVNASGDFAALGLQEDTATGTGGARPEVFSTADLSGDAWTPTGDVAFSILDRHGRSALITFDQIVAGQPQIYTRGAILAEINSKLAQENVSATATFVDTNNDGNPNRLVITGSKSGSGEEIQLIDNSGRIGELGLTEGSYSGTAAVSDFNYGGLEFTLTEGNNAWLPNETMSFNSTAEKGYADSVRIFVPQPSASEISFSTTVDGETYAISGAVNSGAKHVTSITIFDSLGAAHELVTEYEHTNADTKEWVYKISYSKNDPEIQRWLKDPANAVVDPKDPTKEELERANDALIKDRTGTLYFFNDGKLDMGKSFIREIEMTPTGSNPLKITLDKGFLTGFDSPFTTKARDQDGYEMGLLSQIFFEQDGTIRGVYSNGQKQPIGMVALTTFNNPAGLEKTGKNLYEFSPNSGHPVVGKPGDQDRGLIVPGALEMSNVDIATEFTGMIITQRAFQANSRVITTSDELLQEVVNLKR
jgi:flagellar hook protein FlgE